MKVFFFLFFSLAIRFSYSNFHMSFPNCNDVIVTKFCTWLNSCATIACEKGCSNLMACNWIITWWRHQMKTYSALLAICAGNSPASGEFPAQRPVTRSLIFSLICVWINGWVNNREAGDLRRCACYDVIVMIKCHLYWVRFWAKKS